MRMGLLGLLFLSSVGFADEVLQKGQSVVVCAGSLGNSVAALNQQLISNSIVAQATSEDGLGVKAIKIESPFEVITAFFGQDGVACALIKKN